MKTIPTASAASSATSSATATPAATARPVTTATTRPAPNIDYRANVERQSREQKSVGSILSYIVYGLIAFFVISAGLAIYGADIIFKQLHDQSATVSDLDARYTKITSDLSTKLSSTQDTLSQAQAQIQRQQDLIVKQQEELNQLIAASASNDSAIKAEHQARAQDTANLRAHLKELEANEEDIRASLRKY
jgi:plasmid maintenance system antidote protein VapI